jgi:hypothetical protein
VASESIALVAVCLCVALTSIVYSAPVPIALWSLNARTQAASCENGVASELIALVAAGPCVASTSIELLRHSDPIAFRSIDARCDATPIADQLSVIAIDRSIQAAPFRNRCSSFKYVRPRVNGSRVRRINASPAKRSICFLAQ